MSESYWTQVAALREERAYLEAEQHDDALRDLADLLNTTSQVYVHGSVPSRRELGIIRGAVLAGLRQAQDAGWRLLPPEREVER